MKVTSREARVIRLLLGGYPTNSDESPNTRERERERVLSTFEHIVRMRRDCSSLCWLHKFQKVWIHLHVPSRPLLLGDEGTFTYRKHPQAQRIFLVWTHTRMSFSSNIFTNQPLVHTLNPDFLGQQLWLCFSAGSWMSPRVTPELSLRHIPESVGLRFFIGSCMSSRVTPKLGPWQIPEPAIFRSSRHRQLETPGFRMFVTPFLHRIKIPELHTFANSRLHRF
jgi:hypothetical protein